MAGEDEEFYQVLAEHRLGRQGFNVKLDRGFEEGTYCLYVEFDDLASRVGNSVARQQAREYCALLKGQLARSPRCSLGETEDASQNAGPGRKRDLELTYLTFPVLTADGRFHDDAMKKDFKLALVRAGQQWDQVQARADTQRHARREDTFRERLRALLAGDAYAGVDVATKARLLDEVPPLAFPVRGIGP